MWPGALREPRGSTDGGAAFARGLRAARAGQGEERSCPLLFAPLTPRVPQWGKLEPSQPSRTGGRTLATTARRERERERAPPVPACPPCPEGRTANGRGAAGVKIHPLCGGPSLLGPFISSSFCLLRMHHPGSYSKKGNCHGPCGTVSF